MERLSQRELLEALREADKIEEQRVKQTAAVVTTRPHQRRICRCGQCRLCMDNARWEKIYKEKFADPYYYNRDIVRFTSPLNSF